MVTRRGTSFGIAMPAVPCILLGMLALAAGGCSGASAPPKLKPPAARVVTIAPEAREVVDRMASFLKGRKGFGVRQVSTTTVGAGETENKLAGTMEHLLLVERPDRILVSLDGNQKGTGVVASDGKELVIHQKEANRYESTASPDTIASIVANPLVAGMLAIGNADVVTRAFFADDPAATFLDGIEDLSVAGTELVEGRECTHLVARAEGGAWDLWVATGDEPVPVRFMPTIGPMFLGGKNVAVTSIVTFDQWRFDPVFEDSDFAFFPPEGAEKVESLVAAAAPKPRQARRSVHPLVGFPAPPFKLAGTDGARFDLASQKDKIVVLDFWATWCAPCRASLPVIARVCREYADRGVVLRAVNIKEDGSTIRTFLDEEPIDVAVVMDDTGDVAAAYRAEAIPQTVVIGKEGMVQAVHVGAEEGLEAKLRKQLDTLLEGKPLIQSGGNAVRAEPL